MPNPPPTSIATDPSDGMVPSIPASSPLLLTGPPDHPVTIAHPMFIATDPSDGMVPSIPAQSPLLLTAPPDHPVTIAWNPPTASIHSLPAATQTAIAEHISGKKKMVAPAQFDWLGDELRSEISLWKPKIGNGDDADICVISGNVFNYNRLSDAFRSVFSLGRTFFNIYQAHAMSQELGQEWGVHLKKDNNGLYLACSYGGRDRSLEYSSREPKASSPSKQRRTKHGLSKMGCEFVIATSFSPNKQQKDARNEKRITSFCRLTTMVKVLPRSSYTHNHDVGRSSLVVAKKASGAYSLNKLPFELKETLVPLLAFSRGKASLIRGIVRQFLPDNVAITESDIRNIRNCALRAYLRGDHELSITQVGRTTKYSGLDGNAAIKLESDEAASRAREILLDTLQNSNETWTTFCYLKNLQKADKSFAFEIAEDESGRPIGVWWQTGKMRERWIQFGGSLYLDSQKRQMNVFHWPYIGPVVHTSAMKVATVCECIIIQESLPAYAFVLQNLFKHGPQRPKECLRVIFGDCFLTDGLLPMIGLSEDTTNIVYDHYHLLNSVWPHDLGKYLFASLEFHLKGMLHAKSQEEFHQASAMVTQVLVRHPTKYLHFKSAYLDRPHKFSAYKIDEIPLSLGKRGDSPAESNHSSVVAHLDGGAPRQLHDHLQLLLTRQKEIAAKHHQAEIQWWNQCQIIAQEMRRNGEENLVEVLFTLSEWALKKLWKPELIESANYECIPRDDGSSEIRRRGITNGRVIRPGERCKCITRVTLACQCKHEICLHGGRFVKHLFDFRHYQKNALPNGFFDRIPSTETDDEFPINDQNDYQDGPGGNEEMEGIIYGTQEGAGVNDEMEGVSGRTETSDDTITAHSSSQDGAGGNEEMEGEAYSTQEGAGVNDVMEGVSGRFETSDDSKFLRGRRITYKMIIDQANTLATAASVNQRAMQTVLATLIQMTELLRGGGVDEKDLQRTSEQLIAQTQTAMRSRSQVAVSGNTCSHVGQPLPARINGTAANRKRIRSALEGPKPGKKISSCCSFCLDSAPGTRHNMTTCRERMEKGHHIRTGTEFDEMMSLLLVSDAARAQVSPELMKGRVLLEEIPSTTNWLVIQGVYRQNTESVPGKLNTLIHVNCLGRGGVPLDEQSYADCLVRMSGAMHWLSSKGKKATASFSRVLMERQCHAALTAGVSAPTITNDE
jgi:hypothetical protein